MTLPCRAKLRVQANMPIKLLTTPPRVCMALVGIFSSMTSRIMNRDGFGIPIYSKILALHSTIFCSGCRLSAQPKVLDGRPFPFRPIIPAEVKSY